jgi:hypothetical protein
MAPAVESPEWWRDRLYQQLLDRQANLKLLDAWYSGAHPAPRGYAKARALLARLLEMTNTNFMQLVVDAAMERMHVEGFRIGGQISDAAWKIWQGNAWDLGSEMVFLECLVTGEALTLVDPTLNAFGVPTLTPEHPCQAIVEYRPGSFRDRVAGLKVFADDVGEHLVATAYTPDVVVTWWAPLPKQGVAGSRHPQWELQESISGRNPLGEVPLVPFYNRPRMLKPAASEFATVIPIQRRINKTVLDRLVMQEFSAFRQKWATGMEIPRDPATGQDVEPFQVAVDRLLMNEDPAGKFGTFEADDIDGLLKGIDSDVKQIAAIVATPPHYLLGDMVNLAAEAMKAAEASLVSRVRRHMRHLEEPQEAVVRLALKAAGETAPDADMETVWRNPEFRTEGELVDALTKMATLGVPVEALWERWGATQTEIGRWKVMREAEALDPLAQRLLRDVTAPVAGDAGPG